MKSIVAPAFVFVCLITGFVGAALTLNWLGIFANPIPVSMVYFLIGSVVVLALALSGFVVAALFTGSRR